MTAIPVVTVVIPTYNHAHFLPDTLTSLQDQTLGDWEAIVVNNYSDDDTIEVVESFADRRFRLVNFRNKGIIAASRNLGIALARGRYIAFLDSDDTWYPRKLECCVPYLDMGAALVSHGLRYIGDIDRDVYCGPKSRATFDALLDKGSCITPTATVVRKSALDAVGRFSENPLIVGAEDYHLWLKLAKADIRMLFLSEILGQYRVHSGSQSALILKTLNSELSVVDEYLEAESRGLLLFWELRKKRRHGLAYYSAARAMHKSNQYRKALELYFLALGQRPFYFKIHIAMGQCIVNMLFS